MCAGPTGNPVAAQRKLFFELKGRVICPVIGVYYYATVLDIITCRFQQFDGMSQEILRLDHFKPQREVLQDRL